MAGRHISPDAKRKVIVTRVDENEYSSYIQLANDRGTNIAELIRRLLHEEKTGRSRVGYLTLQQRDFVEAIKQIPEDNLEDIVCYALLWKMRLRDLIMEFDRLLDSEIIVFENGKLVVNKEKI